MPQCSHCGAAFPNKVVLDSGRLLHTSKRKYCLTCSPPFLHRTRSPSHVARARRTVVNCGRCQRNLPHSSFYKKPNGDPQGMCKSCFAQYQEERRKLRKKQMIKEMGGECLDCGGVFPDTVYDFHHRDPAGKDVNPSIAFKNWSLKRMREELSKCDLLCSNCHRLRHDER